MPPKLWFDQNIESDAGSQSMNELVCLTVDRGTTARKLWDTDLLHYIVGDQFFKTYPLHYMATDQF